MLCKRLGSKTGVRRAICAILLCKEWSHACSDCSIRVFYVPLGDYGETEERMGSDLGKKKGKKNGVRPAILRFCDFIAIFFSTRLLK